MTDGTVSTLQETANATRHDHQGRSPLEQLHATDQFGLAASGEVIGRLLLNLPDKKEGVPGHRDGLQRSLERLFYVAGAPLCEGMARLDDGTRDGFALFMEGTVYDLQGRPLPGAMVDVWHADATGGYSHFTSNHSNYNLRRRIRTDADGRYRFRTLMPNSQNLGASVAIEPFQQFALQDQFPLEIHCMVSAPGHSPYVTGIFLQGDSRLKQAHTWSTDRGFVVEAVHHNSHERAVEYGVEVPFYTAYFDIRLQA